MGLHDASRSTKVLSARIDSQGQALAVTVKNAMNASLKSSVCMLRVNSSTGLRMLFHPDSWQENSQTAMLSAIAAAFSAAPVDHQNSQEKQRAISVSS